MIFILYGSMFLLVGIFSGMLIGGAVGLATIVANAPLGLIKTLDMASINGWAMSRSFTLAAIPIFIFMGEIAARSGLIMKLFESFLLLTRSRLPGGLLQPVIFASTIFAACSGSSTSSAAALGSIIYPDLKKLGYHRGLSAATLAAGGSLAMLIPPSIVLVIFGSISEASISAMYLGAVIPGFMIAFLFSAYVAIRVPRPAVKMGSAVDSPNPLHGAVSRRDKLRALVNISAFIGLMLTVLGPLYFGMATATEVGALGSAGAILLALAYRKLTLGLLRDSALVAVQVTGMAYFILFGTLTFSMALSSTGFSTKLPLVVEYIGNPHLAMMFLVILYVVMGMFLDPISILLLATPFVLPILSSLGFSVICSGIFIALMIEIALLTPPIGVNLFVLQGSTGVPFQDIAKGCVPFVLILLIIVIILYFFPQIVGWLPRAYG